MMYYGYVLECAWLLHHIWTGWYVALIKHGPALLDLATELNLTYVTKHSLLWPMEYDGDDKWSWFLVRSEISSAVSALSLEKCHLRSTCGKQLWKEEAIKGKEKHMKLQASFLRTAEAPIHLSSLKVVTGPTGGVYLYKETYVRSELLQS